MAHLGTLELSHSDLGATVSLLALPGRRASEGAAVHRHVQMHDGDPEHEEAARVRPAVQRDARAVDHVS